MGNSVSNNPPEKNDTGAVSVCTPPPDGQRIFRGALWSLVERVSTQLVAFLVTLVMARLLTPYDYGLIGMLLIFVELGAAVCTSGLSQALIKKGGGDAAEAGSVLIFNLLSGLALYGLIWAAAPWIARFYGIPELAPLARGIALVVPLRGAGTIWLATLSAALDFRRQAMATFIALLLAGTAGIAGALLGFGVWAIVAFYVGNALFTLLMLLAVTPGRKLSRWDAHSFASLYRFGINVTGATLADIVFNNAYLIAIGRCFPAADVGFFTRGRQLASVPPISVSEVLRRVAYPVLCRFENERAAMQRAAIRFLRMGMYIAVPMMLLLALNSESLVVTILGDKWRPAAELMSILCLGSIWVPMDALNLTLLPAGGNPAILLKTEFARKGIGVATLLCTLPFGVKWICIGYVISAVLGMMLSSAVSGRLYGIGFSRQMGSLSGIFLCAVLSAGGGAWLASLSGVPWISCLSGIVGGGAIYVFITWQYGFKEPRELISRLRLFFINKRS